MKIFPTAPRSTPANARPWWRRFYGRRWSEYSRAFLARAENAFCRQCLRAGIEKPATDVDHVTPFKGCAALFWSSTNHQPLCHECHSRKTARELAADKRRG